jgi:hypothetical protein
MGIGGRGITIILFYMKNNCHFELIVKFIRNYLYYGGMAASIEDCC